MNNINNDIRTKRAIERDLEIIGEAINRIMKEDASVHISYSKQIISTRNRIIHSYDAISDETIWGIIINHLPNLKLEITELLNK